MRSIQKASESNALEAYEDSLPEESPSRLRSVMFFLLCTILVVSTIAYGAVDPWSTAILSILSGGVLLLWLGYSFSARELRFSSNLLQLPLLGFLVIGIIQLLPIGGAEIPADVLSIPVVKSLSLDPYATRLFVIQLCIYIIFFAASLAILENQRRQQIMVFTVITFGSVMAFFGIIQSLANTNPNSILGMRENPNALPFATFVNRHHFAAFMNMIIGLVLGLLFGNSTKSDKRLLLIISLVLMGIAVMFTGSRGGVISLLGVVAFVVLANLLIKKDTVNSENKRAAFQRNFLLVGGGLAVIIVLLGSALFFGGEKSVLRGIGLNNEADATSGRAHFWQTALQIITHNPILGVGFDAFGMAFTKYDTWNGLQRVDQAHNEYLQVLADAGILGFICLAAFIFLLFKQGLRIVSRSEDAFRTGMGIGAMAGCFGILIHSFFDFPLRTPSNAFFFLTLASLATIATFYAPASKKRRKRSVEEE